MAAVRYDTPESRVPSDNKQLVLEDYVSELVARAVQAASKDRGIDRYATHLLSSIFAHARWC